MASELVVPVVKIENVRIHSNSDNLDICDVLGYQMCVPRGKYKGGELAVYFPADVLIPAEWADKFGVRNYLKGENKDRVGRVKLRGEPSFGLVVEVPEGLGWKEGDNVASFYGVQKYIPPIRVSCGDAAAYDEQIDPYFYKFTDVQNGRIFTDVLQDGEEVIFTEKIHGTSGRVGVIAGHFAAGSMEVRRKMPIIKREDGTEEAVGFGDEETARNTYWFPLSIRGVRELLKGVGHDKNPILYGEVYGGSVQSLDYGVPSGKGLGFRVFGLRVNGKFVDWGDLERLCREYGVDIVPVLWRGSFSMAKAKELADGTSTMASHMREGCVVYPVKERDNPKVGRAILKYISTAYELSKHKERDTKDV